MADVRILSMINLPRESVTATEIVAWWTSMPIYFSWLITVLLSVGGDTNDHNLPQSGPLLYCVHSPSKAGAEFRYLPPSCGYSFASLLRAFGEAFGAHDLDICDAEETEYIF